MKIIFILILPFIMGLTSTFAGKDEMNGIKFKEFKNFPEKWGLVTIRFRKDTGEMRLTYANSIAMKTLTEGSINYPDGAVFAKTGIHTGVDPQFESSVVPKGIRRYQLMVKNKKKYASTGGWGYGLFDAEGKTFPEDPVTTQNACYACHTIVENRGDVFSQPFSFVKNAHFTSPQNGLVLDKIKFEWIEIAQVTPQIKEFIPKTFKKIRILSHKKMSENVFQGTLDEVRPTLEDQAKKFQSPALFSSVDGKRFVLVFLIQTDDCVGQGAYQIISTDIENKVQNEKVCTHD